VSVSRKGWIVIAANAAVITSVLLATIVVPKGASVVVVASPWGGADRALRIIAESGGALVEGGRFDWIALAHSEEKNFPSKLMERGAWLVLDPTFLAGCLRSI
jgi:hypothetical protein